MSLLAPASSVRLVIEHRLRGMLTGWMHDGRAPGKESLNLLFGGSVQPLVLRRCDREDVASALGLPCAPYGFEADLGWEVWREVVLKGHSPDCYVNGRDVTAQLTAARLTETAWPTASLGEVEALQGLDFRGWLVPSGGLMPTLSLLCDGQPLACPTRWVERMDVAAAHWLPHAQVGFELELPGQIWRQARDNRVVSLQVLANGDALGPPHTLSASVLPDLLLRQHRPREHQADVRHCLLVLEHLVMAGAMPSLPQSSRELLLGQLRSAGLPEALVLGHAAGRAERVRLSVRAPRGRLGRYLRHRWFARLALKALQGLRQRPSRQAQADRWEIALTQATGLFDLGVYGNQVDVTELQGHSALRHYVMAGDALSLVPNRLLDPRLYTGQLPGRRHPGVNRLLHYALQGRFDGLRTSAWFDAGHYVRANPDVAASGMDPLSHFLRHGWREGRSPLADFSVNNESAQSVFKRLRRLACQSDGRQAADVVDYLLAGLPEGAPLSLDGLVPWAPPRQLAGRDFLNEAHWQALPARPAGACGVAVIVPVYAGVQETLRCLWAVLSAPCQTPFELVVVDDCSPDPALSAMLVRLAQQGWLRLLVNQDNLGFVRTVNRALAATPGQDVVILNADTCVANDWLDRLLAHAQAEPRAASVTPLSNNATVCSYPQTLAENPTLADISPSELDALAARTLAGVHVDAPTGVGFCMYMRRSCLDQIGLLDAERFGRGFGEENDWCQRAAEQGWRNLLAADVLVLHDGGVSFAGEASARALAALDILALRHPAYQASIDAFVAADPLGPARLALDVARLVRHDARPRTLMISHARGGGTARFELEEAQRLDRQGQAVILMRPGAVVGTVSLLLPGAPLVLPNLTDLSLAEPDLIESALSRLGVRAILLNHLVDFPADMAEQVAAWSRALAAPLRIMVHDYHAVCPRINFVNLAGQYCGEPAPQVCNRCLQADETGRAAGDIEDWRRAHRRLLASAQQVVVPDVDVAERLLRYFPGLPLVVRAHETLRVRPPRFQVGPVRKILVVGALSRIKGFDVVLQVLSSRAWADAAAQLSLLGYAMEDEALSQAGAQVLGRYDDSSLVDRLLQEAPDLVWLPSIWPETYNYVLSAALEAGCRVAVFDIGAPARRLREHPMHARILPLALARDPEALAAALLRSLADLGRVGAAAQS
jgi:O-antigen biosynthesis protein